MKQILTFILCFLFTYSWAQTEIPLQNGRACFSFKNNVESKNICASTFFDLSKYAEYTLFTSKNAQLVSQYFLNSHVFEGFSVGCGSILQNQKRNLQCADEVHLMPNSYRFNFTVSYKKKKALLKILNDEITLKNAWSSSIILEINAKIIFKSKTEYELIFSDAYLTYAHTPKGERMPKLYRVELGEFYTNYKNSGESFPDNDLFFKSLVLSIENADKCLKQALQECINFYD